MDFDLTAQQAELRRRAREFAEAELAPTAAERDAREEFSRALFDRIAQAGFAGLTFPPEYGGAGADFLGYVLVLEEFARACASTVLVLASHTLLAAECIYRHGGEDLRRRYLVPLARGERLGCFSITEPRAGSDVGAIQTKAVLRGDEYVLEGHKVYATNAGEAEVYVVLARTDPSAGTRGLSAFVVEPGFPGFTVGKPLQGKLGMRASVQRELHFADCRVPKANLLGREGDGFRVAMQALDRGRVGIAAQGVGIARAAYEAALAHAKRRVQFGKALAEQQSIAFTLADMAAEVDAARLLTYRAASLIQRGERASVEAAMAKRYATDAAMAVATDAVQLLGGLGLSRASPVERYFRDAKVTQVYEGSNQIMRVVISGAILR